MFQLHSLFLQNKILICYYEQNQCFLQKKNNFSEINIINSRLIFIKLPIQSQAESL